MTITPIIIPNELKFLFPMLNHMLDLSFSQQEAKDDEIKQLLELNDQFLKRLELEMKSMISEYLLTSLEKPNLDKNSKEYQNYEEEKRELRNNIVLLCRNISLVILNFTMIKLEEQKQLNNIRDIINNNTKLKYKINKDTAIVPRLCMIIEEIISVNENLALKNTACSTELHNKQLEIEQLLRINNDLRLRSGMKSFTELKNVYNKHYYNNDLPRDFDDIS